MSSKFCRPSLQPIGDIQIRQDPDVIVGVGLAVSGDVRWAEHVDARRLGGHQFFPELALSRGQLYAEDASRDVGTIGVDRGSVASPADGLLARFQSWDHPALAVLGGV